MFQKVYFIISHIQPLPYHPVTSSQSSLNIYSCHRVETDLLLPPLYLPTPLAVSYMTSLHLARLVMGLDLLLMGIGTPVLCQPYTAGTVPTRPLSMSMGFCHTCTFCGIESYRRRILKAHMCIHTAFPSETVATFPMMAHSS